jgi:hypothetical protein
MPILKQRVQDLFRSPETYARVGEGRLSDGLKYVVIRALIALVVPIVLAAPRYVQLARSDFLGAIDRLYPDSLIVTIHNGVATINQPQPYAIATPDQLPSPATGPRPHNLVTFDTTHPLTDAEVRKYDSYMVVGDTTVYARNDSEIRDYSLTSVRDFTMSRPIFDNLIGDLYPIVHVGIFILPFMLVLVAVFFMSIYFLVGALIGGLMVQAIAGIRGMTLTFANAYLMALFAGIPMALYGMIASALSLDNFWVSALVFVMIIWVNVVPSSIPAAVEAEE